MVYRDSVRWPIFHMLSPPMAWYLVDDRTVFQPGLYFLTQGEEIVYIGQSGDVRNRVQQHRKEGKKQFDQAFFTPVAEASERLRYEGILILAALPRYNRSCNLGITSDGRVYDLTRSTYTRLAAHKAKAKLLARNKKGVARRRKPKSTGD